MQHRIAAGVTVENEDKVPLVLHRKRGVYGFWVAPSSTRSELR